MTGRLLADQGHAVVLHALNEPRTRRCRDSLHEKQAHAVGYVEPGSSKPTDEIHFSSFNDLQADVGLALLEGFPAEYGSVLDSKIGDPGTLSMGWLNMCIDMIAPSSAVLHVVS